MNHHLDYTGKRYTVHVPDENWFHQFEKRIWLRFFLFFLLLIFFFFLFKFFNDIRVDLWWKIVNSHEVKQFEQTLVLLMLNINNMVKDFALNISHYLILHLILINFDYNLKQSKQFIQIHIHLKDFPGDHLWIFLTMLVQFPNN